MNTNKKKKNHHIKLVLSFLYGAWPHFLIGILCALGLSLFELLNPQLIARTVDSVIGDKPMNLPEPLIKLLGQYADPVYLRAHLWIIPLCVIALSLCAVLCRYFFRVSNTRGAETLVQTMRNSLYTHLSRLPYAWHMKNQTGDIIQRCTSDVDMVKRFLSEQLTSVLRIVILIAMSLFFMFRMNVSLAVVALLFVPIVLGYSFFFHRKIGAGFEVCDENEGKLSAIVQENLTGVRVVRAFGRERYEEDKFDRQNNHYTALWLRLCRFLSAFWGTGDLISGLQVLSMVVLGSVSCVRGNMTAGDFIAFLSYNSMLTWPVRQLGRMISEMSKAGISVDRIADIMDAPVETDREGALKPDMTGDIRFDHVSFGYDGCPELLHDVSFTVKAGTTFGILGSTGSGKSTLMYLLTRLYNLSPDGGHITIGGVDVADMDSRYLRSHVGMVMQEPYLFSRTIAENIAIANDSPTPDMSAVEDAAATACLTDTLKDFEKGYETFVGERGVTLSGGQKQRVAIARMLIGKTPIMIFDDSLSAVDAETDAKIRAALKKKMAGATVIIISHRVTTLASADRILVLDGGRIIEEGTNAELLAQDGIYRKIHDIQLPPDALGAAENA